MKVMVSELIDEKLDYWVANALDLQEARISGGVCRYTRTGVSILFSPSTDWSQGGPIIDRMKPTSFYYWKRTGKWTCAWGNGPRWGEGETALIAAMRCFVASKFGEEVDDRQAHNL